LKHFAITAGMAVLSLWLPQEVRAARQATLPEFIPANPYSEFYVDEAASQTDAITIDFCAEWNPEFPWNGHRCCRQPKSKKKMHWRERRRGGTVCYAERFKANFCEEMTADQRGYSDQVASGEIPDILSFLDVEMTRSRGQAYCTVNNGFLAFGRRLIPTDENRIKLRFPGRCVEFGTDPMIGMLEWLGRRVNSGYSAPEVKGVHLLVGDISSPKGGCLAGRNGLRGHASHTSGQDVDLGFISAYENKESPNSYVKHFDGKPNWWFMKQVFRNPYACVKVVFLDRTHIRKLAKAARGDEDWQKFGRFIRHSKGHHNHFHIRIGDGPGPAGCQVDAHPELETEDSVPMEVELPDDVDANRLPAGKILKTS